MIAQGPRHGVDELVIHHVTEIVGWYAKTDSVRYTNGPICRNTWRRERHTGLAAQSGEVNRVSDLGTTDKGIPRNRGYRGIYQRWRKDVCVVDGSVVCDPVVLRIKGRYDCVLNGVVVIPEVAQKNPVRIGDGMIDFGNHLIVVGRHRKVVRVNVAGTIRQWQECL